MRGAGQAGAVPDGKRVVMIDVDAGGRDRLALAVLVQYRMATTEQMHWVIAPGVRIEQTRRRLARLREEGLIERITLPQAGRRRVWFPTAYGVKVACEWPELRERRPSRTASGPTAVRLSVGHGLTVTETGLAFLQDARRRGDVCRPLDWMTEVHHSIGNGYSVIPDALLYYRHGPSSDGSMLRALVEVDRATMGPERLAAQPPGWLHGQPSGDPSMTFWMRFADGREPDLASLPFLADAAYPAIMELGEMPSATLELTIHLWDRPAPGWLACQINTRHVAGGFHEEDCDIWDSRGVLVAQSRQLARIP
ncbi:MULTISPECIES: replication-relaxation family protein [Streptomyces]|uniref:replication-relaxation family protein n=1 Tax=Streptomyces TaxID=1883 RepID=UPI000A8BD7CB